MSYLILQESRFYHHHFACSQINQNSERLCNLLRPRCSTQQWWSGSGIWGHLTSETCLQPVTRSPPFLSCPNSPGPPFLCSGASEEEDTWRLAIPRGNHSFPSCVCDSVYVTASDSCESCPATNALPPDTSPDPQQAHVSPRDDQLYARWLCFSSFRCGRSRKSAPLISQEQLRVLEVIPLDCFELTQESQPL